MVREIFVWKKYLAYVGILDRLHKFRKCILLRNAKSVKCLLRRILSMYQFRTNESHEREEVY